MMGDNVELKMSRRKNYSRFVFCSNLKKAKALFFYARHCFSSKANNVAEFVLPSTFYVLNTNNVAK